MPADKPTPIERNAYGYHLPLQTRWMDNDVYGHVNNVQYYSYFDTVANTFLIERAGLDIRNGSVIGYVVHSECHYLSGVAFPQTLTAALGVQRIGNSSVVYAIGIFAEGADAPSAHGTFTHVFVDRHTERPTAIPEEMREAFGSVLIA